MSRFPVPPEDQPLDQRVLETFDDIRAQLGLGHVPEIFRAMSLNPAVLRGTWENYKATVLAGRVPTGLKMLMGQAIAYLMGCSPAAITDAPSNAANTNGYALRSGLNARERQMLDFALQVATEPDTLTDEDFEALRKLGLWDDEIFELTATAGIYLTLTNFGLTTFGRSGGVTGTARSTTTMPKVIKPPEKSVAQDAAQASEATLAGRMSTVVEIGLALMSTPTFSEIFQVLSDQAKWVLDFTQVSVSLLEAGGATYRLHTLVADCSDISCEPTVSPFIHFAATEGLPGAALSADRPIITSDLARHPQASPRLEMPLTQAGIRSEMVLPLRVGERTFGTLNFAARTVDAYHADDLRVGRVLALQLSAALDAARLYGQIEEERSTLVSVIQGAVEGILMIDRGGIVLVVNPVMQSILEREPAALIGLPMDQALADTQLQQLFHRTLQTSDTATADITLADGRVFQATANTVFTQYEEIIGYVAILHDVSTLKALTRMKSEFVATVSHDLKTPITAMKLSAGLLGRAGTLNDMQTQLVERVNRSADRMLALVSNLLDLGKIEAGMNVTRVPCNLATLAEEVIEEQRPIVESKQQSIVFESPTIPLIVDGDAARLKQVIANFTSNAIKYTPNGGRITIAVRAKGDQIELTVSDTGYGISAKDLPSIFDKFYRVDNEQTNEIEGSGLGLAITRSIIEQQGGQIWVESQLGQGSTFGFRLAAHTEMHTEMALAS